MYGTQSTRLALATLLWALIPASTAAQQKLHLGGEVGIRLEYMSHEAMAGAGSGLADQHRFRHRGRVRLAGRYEASPRVTAGFRLGTGSGDYPSSGWTSFNGDFRRSAFSLDRAYVRFSPAGGVSLSLGVDDNAVRHPSELVWDTDVAPAGLTAVWRSAGLEVVTGGYMLREVRTLRADEPEPFLFVGAASYSGVVGGSPYRAGGFSYLYSETRAIAAAIAAGSLNGDYRTNRPAPDRPSEFFSAFRVVGGHATWAPGDWSVAAEVAVNLGARSNGSVGEGYAQRENLGWILLVTKGSLAGRGAWNVTTGAARVEADAVLAAFNSDDLQQTNVFAVPLWVRVRIDDGALLVWDSYIQSKLNTALAGSGGFLHADDHWKLRTRLSLQVAF